MASYALTEIPSSENGPQIDGLPTIPLMQTPYYASWQHVLHRTVRRYIISRDGTPIAVMQIIFCPLFGNTTYGYVPYGPVTTDTSPAFFSFVARECGRIATQQRAVFIRIDPTPAQQTKPKDVAVHIAPPATMHGATFQPRVEWYLDVRGSLDVLLNAMDKNTRYSIRTAEKRDITTEIVTTDCMQYFETFYDLMRTTATRNHFHLHAYEYYKTIFTSLETQHAFLSIARYQDQVLVIEVCIPVGDVVHHVFGCSSNAERTRMPVYAAQWAAMQYTKAQGYRAYNFGGISTPEAPHPSWANLTTFKRRFGGYEHRHGVCFDVVVQWPIYFLYIARKYVQQLKKR